MPCARPPHGLAREGFGYSAELARDWLDRMHNEPGFNETWRLYWEGLPTPGHVFTPEVRELQVQRQPIGESKGQPHGCCCYRWRWSEAGGSAAASEHSAPCPLPQLYTDQHLDMLHTPELVGCCRPLESLPPAACCLIYHACCQGASTPPLTLLLPCPLLSTLGAGRSDQQAPPGD